MFAAESYTSRHYIEIVAIACLCVLLGGPSYAAGAESLVDRGRDVATSRACRAPAGPGPMPATWSLTATRERPSALTATWC